MAPEQADPARAGLVDYRSDIYSAAVVLYEMLARRLPLAFLSVTDLRRAVDARAARPAPIEKVRPDVRPDLARVIERALGREVEDRPGTAWEWRESLKQCLLGEATPSQAGPPVAVRPRTETGSTLPLASRGSGGRVSTLPAAPRRSTAVLPSASGGQQRTPPVSIPPPPVSVRPQPDTGTSPAVRPRQRVRVAGAVAVAAGLALTAGLLLPWASISGGSGITDRLGTAFRGGNLIVLAAVVLVLAGWRMWQARRRWAAVLAASAALLAGLGAWAVAVYEVVVIRGRVVATLRNAGAAASLGVGLYVVLGGGLAGFLAGYGALRRLRSQARRERTSTLIQGASIARR